MYRAFSSARKWSAASFTERGTWVIGAPEMVWLDRPADDAVRVRFEGLAAEGRRVLLLARTETQLAGEVLPEGLDAAALVVFDEKIRDDAAETLRYFAEQGVQCKVVSGDSPRTVSPRNQSRPFAPYKRGAERLPSWLRSRSTLRNVCPFSNRIACSPSAAQSRLPSGAIC